MRIRTLIALAIAATMGLTACSGSGSGLTGKTWPLTALTHRVASGMGPVSPADKGKYTIEFKTDGTYNAKADCNQTSGTYTTTSDHGLTITSDPASLVDCGASSYADQYIHSLATASSYAIVDGELTIVTDEGGWSAVFK